ncbi:MAG: two-component system, OmpR family, phosphate regulon sensor histidine kinase PhoR [Clostridiales bacterium]|nr:two-component system, OmpR family, phosphate regulon sensor histidine kinase PhoR [Clostridiales bacterium]MDN5281692.1 two-component system, OmpR family, phosphate regulon sensor histidine kinase PhoR [Candidatus Ozemobacter sp.]
MNPDKHKTSNRYQLSLVLILVSFLLLFFISYKALSFQQQYLSRQNRDKMIAQLDQISQDFFSKLAEEPIPLLAIPMPMENSSYPSLSVPDNDLARLTLAKISLNRDSKLVNLTEAELNAQPQEQDFWRYLLLKQYLEKENYFQTRKIAFRILNSNFDYLLSSGRTLKTQTALVSAETFLQENNIEGFKKWLYRLRTLPAPVSIPESPEKVFETRLPDSARNWLNFLFLCYQKTYAPELNPGWFYSRSTRALLIQHQNGLVAFPEDFIIESISKRLADSGFSDLKQPQTQKPEHNAHLLARSNGLWIELPADQIDRIPGGFFLLLTLTTIGILGLFRFSLYEWQFVQKRNLLEEEETFFRQTAHDIKTPLTTVRFLAETICLRRYKDEAQKERYLGQLLTESEKAAELIDQLLLSARLRKQAVKADLKPISPPFRIKDLLLRFKPRFAGWEIREEFICSDDIVADPDMFDRVIINLFENVLRHASDAKILHIRVESVSENDLLIGIGDQGPGLGDLKSGKIDLMHEALPYNSNRGGSGTGLMLVKQIIRIHSGEFFAEPRQPKGLWMTTRWKTAKNDRDSYC